jgi:glycosyltransferase involved in cell wall biosynthesis
MVIAVNTRFLLNDYLEGYGYFIHECFKRIVTAHPEHRFIFIFDRSFDSRFIYADNVTPVVAGPQARHPLLWKWWYDVKIPAVLRKYKADVFVSPDGHCSLKTKVPQCMVTHDLAFLHHPLFIKKSHLRYYKKNTPRFINKASVIATVSQFSKDDIIQQYKINPSKIDIVYSAAKNIFQPVSIQNREAVKDRFTGGKEYFLYVGAIHPRKNLKNLLKGFSRFKKRQQSSIKLILVGRLAWKYDSFLEELKTYKYRQDVILTGYIDDAELAQVMAAAYALVYLSYFEGFGVPVLEAMQCGVPVITTEASSMQEIAGEAALYANPEDPMSIGEKMMEVYKNETGRTAMIDKGIETARQFNWDKTAELLWQSICKCKS